VAWWALAPPAGAGAGAGAAGVAEAAAAAWAACVASEPLAGAGVGFFAEKRSKNPMPEWKGANLAPQGEAFCLRGTSVGRSGWTGADRVGIGGAPRRGTAPDEAG
jgi:hypothetical protein